MDKIVLVLLGIWAILTGIALVTNIQIVWMAPLTGLAALCLGVVCLLRAFR